MSFIKSALIGTLLLLGAVALAYLLQVETGGSVYSNRLPASADQEIHLRGLKEQVLKPKEGFQIIHTEKIRGPISLELTGPDEKAAPSSGEIIPLHLKINSETDLENVTVNWVIPAGVQVVSGATRQTLSLRANESRTVELSIQLLTGDNRQIHVQVTGANGDAQFAALTQYNTVFEHLLKGPEKQQALKKLEGQPATELKVFQ